MLMLVVGLVHPVKRLQQKLEILQLDFVDDEVRCFQLVTILVVLVSNYFSYFVRMVNSGISWILPGLPPG